MPLIFFHTIQNNAELFDQLLGDDLAGNSKIIVREDLLNRATQAGELTDGLRSESRNAMRAALYAAGPNARLVCTCSTLGPAADDLRDAGLPVMRIDRALAEDAFGRGAKVAVVYTARSSNEPTRRLFEQVARDMEIEPELNMLFAEEAWPHLEKGDQEAYLKAIAEQVDGIEEAHDAIALAQASMHGAADLTDRSVLTSPQSALRAIAAAAPAPA